MTACVYGVGTSRFGKQQDTALSKLVWDAATEALDDAGAPRIDAVYVGSVFGPFGAGQRALHALGITEVPIIGIENACASGSTAFQEAYWAVRGGRFEHVLALGVEHMSSRFSGAIPPEPTDTEGRSGLALPAMYAMAASRYQACHGVTPEQLAAVTVKNRRHGRTNERAQFRAEVTVEQVLASPMVADPLTLLQCCPISDGAAAAVLGPARGQNRDVPVRGCALHSGGLWDHRSEHVWGFDLVTRTAADAYDRSGVDPRDVDLFEVHDAFTIGEIVTVEALGLAPLGEGAKLAEAGTTALGGAQPVNPSGGLLSRGHALGATGLAQLAEVVRQLRGEARARQVPNARLGLVETMGGGVSGIDGNACAVSVLEARR